ncbi:MAG: hypothetical protein RLZZ399_818 [Verrucomicrobiota bacterium]|jgi:ribosomal protein L24
MKKRFKIGDQVVVFAGGQKNASGKISRFSKDGSRVFIEGLPPVRRHQKRRGGGAVDLPRSVDQSNVKRVDSASV